MLRSVRALPALFRVGFAEAVAYRAEFAVWLLSTNMPLVMLALWSAVARDAPIGRFGQAELTAYFLAALVVRLLTGAWVIWELNFEIRQGTLSYRLLRPVHPLFVYACENVAAMPLRVALVAPVGVLFAFTAGRGQLSSDPLLLALCPLTVFGAWLITFLAMSIIGTLAFWLEQATSLFEVWLGLFGIFSGYLVPLELYPPWLQAVARALPFRYMLAFPTELVVGMLPRERALAELGIQWLYVGALLVAARAAWRVGVRRFSAVGG